MIEFTLQPGEEELYRRGVLKAISDAIEAAAAKARRPT
jgi:hypothetical protein